MNYKVYEVWLDGQMVTKGTAKELADQLKCTPKAVQSAAHFYGYSKLLGMYEVLKSGETISRQMPRKRVLPKTDPEQEKFDSMVWLLKTTGVYYYGMKDPSPIFPELKKLGLKCKNRVEVEHPPIKRGRGRPPKPVQHYYVEVVNAERQRASV